ncbi:MAG TPA: DUF309 domain-containing protein [Terracidiphilus sp.]|nr:DUF309 domain-containing protein [Terracidiphilus sp.]
MIFDWSRGELAEGLQCYRNQQFWQAHEHWEGVWLKCSEPDKTFLQALIQVTAAFHHVQRKNYIGASSLLTRALRRLEPYPEEYGAIAVGELRNSVRAWLENLENADSVREIAFPVIR